MWRFLLVACLWLLDCPDSQAQDVINSRYTCTGNTVQPEFVHEAVEVCHVSFAPAIFFHYPTCPFNTGHPPSGPDYGSYGWTCKANSPDLTRHGETPINVAPGRALEIASLTHPGEPLPVDLTHFLTLSENLDIRLNRATTELNRIYFGIEHALGGVSFPGTGPGTGGRVVRRLAIQFVDA